METSKTYVFNPEGSGNNGGMMSLIAPLLQQRGVDPNVLLAMKGNNGFGNGDGSWFIWLLFILCFCGWGGNGFGFGGRGNGAGLANEINNDYGRSLLMDAIGGNRNALSNLATQLNCTEGQIQQAISALTTQVQNVGNQVGMSGMQTINALQQGNMQIASQLADCCCRVNNNITAMDGNVKLAMCQQTGTLQNAINNVAVGQERGFSNVAYETQRQTCDLHNAIKESTQTIVDGQKQAEMREMQNKIDSLREENSTFKSSAMTSQIVGQAVAPINAVLAGLQSEVAGIKCKLPETVTTPYSPFTAVPNCVAYQAGLYGLNAANNGFWG
ncbi:hypothetical protein [Segatella copri]|jgi:hypothetical protein|nr:hypothetical protein [Segatella copri]UVY02458.1 MAG: hypothetical protein [Bacteriophage sp.]DAU08119.1 MAG TPA: hypothetical protein [Caudoviricetes sp.]